MRMRPFFLASPAAFVAAAGLSFVISTSAMAGDAGQVSNVDALIAQAAPIPPAPPPPTARAPGEHRERPAVSPRAMCLEHVAHRVGFRAYLKVRLDLKPEQMAAWSAFEKAADEATAKQTARCAAMPAEMKTPPTFVERWNMREEAMKARLDSLEAVKPSILALYNTLTPEQKVLFDRPFMGLAGGGHEHGHMRGLEHGPR
jgi:LTXXQ motif family protein